MQMHRADSRATSEPHQDRHSTARPWVLAFFAVVTPLLFAWLAGNPAALNAMTSASEPVPVEVAPQQDAVQQDTTLTMRVTQQNGGCNTATDSIVAAAGSTLYYCYTLTNNSPMSLTKHIIADSTATVVRTAFDYVLAPGGSINIWNPPLNRVISDTAQVSETRLDTWAGVAADGSTQVQASDSVLVTVVDPGVEATLTVGRDPGTCGTSSAITVPAGSTPTYLCITLTNNGSVALTSHTLNLTGGYTGNAAFNRNLAPGQSMRITASEANQYANLGTLTIANVSGSTPSTVNLLARALEANGVAASDSAAATITGGSGAITVNAAVRANPIIRANDCPATGATSITVVKGTPIWWCVQIVNSGNVTLTVHHLTAITPTINITIVQELRPSATLYITQATSSLQGPASALGPYTITKSINQTFVVTSTNALGFRVTNNRGTSITSADPTATPTDAPTSTPTVPPSTPTITPTPPPTATPFPTPIPTDTPITPSPTWTRSFALSGLATPTPPGQVAAAELVPTVDFLGTAIARATQDTQATLVASGQVDPNAPLSPLATPTVAAELAGFDPTQMALLQQGTLTAVAATVTTAAQLAAATPTPTWTPTWTPQPTATPTPTVTPTSTQRPIVYPTPVPPASVGTIFTQVLGSSFSATGLIFLLTGTLVFFGTLGTVVALGFLRNGRQRFEVYEMEENIDDDAAFDVTGADQPKPKPQSKGKDSWPSSLP